MRPGGGVGRPTRKDANDGGSEPGCSVVLHPGMLATVGSPIDRNRADRVPKIVVLGEALIDLFAEGNLSLTDSPSFRPAPGGAPANVAVALGRLGAAVGFIGRVGDDPFGELLQATLSRHGVDTRHFEADGRAPTMLAVVAAATPDDPQFILYNGANELLDRSDLPIVYIEGAEVFVFGSVTLAAGGREAAFAAASLARRAGRRVLFDVNLRPGLWPDPGAARRQIEAALDLTTIVKANRNELEFLTGSPDPAVGCRILLDRGIELCCASLGAEGAYLASGAAAVQVPGFEVDLCNTAGCGDAFVAAVALEISEFGTPPSQLGQTELLRIGRFANACGAIVATLEGAMATDLDRDRVRRLLASKAN